MKKIISIVTLLLATFIMSGCGAAKLTPAKQALIDNKTVVYTQVAMWSDKNKVSGTNYSVTNLIPINSEVTILAVGGSAINFEVNGQKISYLVTSKYTKITSAQMLDRLFATKKVDISKSSKKVQANIINGIVANGMTKEEVLLARGYPPAHETATTEKNTWKYWRNRWTTGVVTFQDNVVIKSSVR
jgi:uncharacterized protein YceK